MQPDDKEAVITQAEHRIKIAVQRDADERWKNRMAIEDKITTNTVEVLRSDLNGMSAKMAEEVVCMKSSHHGSAAITVSGSTASGGSAGNFAGRLAQNTFVASRIELEVWGCWRNIRGTGIFIDEAKEHVSTTKARFKQDDLNVFDWDLTDRDQGNFGLSVVQRRGHSHLRKRVQLDLQQVLTNQPLPFKGANVRATLELDPVKRPWNKAQAIFIGVMRECTKLPRETFDIRWVDSGLRVSVSGPRLHHDTHAVASFTIGTTWELNREKFQSSAPPHVDVEEIQTFLSDA